MTVVVPTKDRPAMLARALAAVRAQVGVRTTLVVVDDGSSPDLARETRQVADRCTFLRHERSRGVSVARNAGLAVASTPWVAFLDDDDLWAPDKLRRQLEAACQHPDAQWVCSGSAHFTRPGGLLAVHLPPSSGDVLHDMLRGNVVPGGGSGVLARTSLLRRIGGMDPTFSTLADWDCWVRLAARSPVATVSWPDVGYLVQPGGMAHDTDLAQREMVRLLAKHAALYRQHGLALDDQRWIDYQRSLAYRSGAWLSGVRLSTRLLVQHRQAGAVLQPVIALLPERARRQARVWRLRKTTRALPQGALDWLAPAAALHDDAASTFRVT